MTRTAFEKRNKIIASELVKLAAEIQAEEASAPVEDEQFTKKLTELRQALTRMTSMKNKRLNSYGIQRIQGNETVEALIDHLLSIARTAPGGK